MATRPGRRWLLVLALCALSCCDPESHHEPPRPQHHLNQSERSEMHREILALLGLPAQPRLRATPAASTSSASAPLFMLDLYHSMTGDHGKEDSGPLLRDLLQRADLVMSFVNVVEHNHTGTDQDPCWKEFWFDLTQIPPGEEVTAAEFRIYKVPSTHQINSILHVSVFEVVKEQFDREPHLVHLSFQNLKPEDEGWVVVNITKISDRWLLNSKKKLGLRLYVETEDGNHNVDPGLAGLLGHQSPHSKQPFMDTFFRASPSPVSSLRVVRSLWNTVLTKILELLPLNKEPEISDAYISRGWQPCKQHKLYVSFQDIERMDWIIAPKGYSAYYCDGRCFFPLQAFMNATNHAVLQSLMHMLKPDTVPQVCCTPTKLGPTSLLYYDSNDNVILRKQRNMVAQACGCQLTHSCLSLLQPSPSPTQPGPRQL